MADFASLLRDLSTLTQEEGSLAFRLLIEVARKRTRLIFSFLSLQSSGASDKKKEDAAKMKDGMAISVESMDPSDQHATTLLVYLVRTGFEVLEAGVGMVEGREMRRLVDKMWREEQGEGGRVATFRVQLGFESETMALLQVVSDRIRKRSVAPDADIVELRFEAASPEVGPIALDPDLASYFPRLKRLFVTMGLRGAVVRDVRRPLTFSEDLLEQEPDFLAMADSCVARIENHEGKKTVLRISEGKDGYSLHRCNMQVINWRVLEGLDDVEEVQFATKVVPGHAVFDLPNLKRVTGEADWSEWRETFAKCPSLLEALSSAVIDTALVPLRAMAEVVYFVGGAQLEEDDEGMLSLEAEAVSVQRPGVFLTRFFESLQQSGWAKRLRAFRLVGENQHPQELPPVTLMRQFTQLTRLEISNRGVPRSLLSSGYSLTCFHNMAARTFFAYCCPMVPYLEKMATSSGYVAPLTSVKGWHVVGDASPIQLEYAMSSAADDMYFDWVEELVITSRAPVDFILPRNLGRLRNLKRISFTGVVKVFVPRYELRRPCPPNVPEFPGGDADSARVRILNALTGAELARVMALLPASQSGMGQYRLDHGPKLTVLERSGAEDDFYYFLAYYARMLPPFCEIVYAGNSMVAKLPETLMCQENVLELTGRISAVAVQDMKAAKVDKDGRATISGFVLMYGLCLKFWVSVEKRGELQKRTDDVVTLWGPHAKRAFCFPFCFKHGVSITPEKKNYQWWAKAIATLGYYFQTFQTEPDDTKNNWDIFVRQLELTKSMAGGWAFRAEAISMLQVMYRYLPPEKARFVDKEVVAAYKPPVIDKSAGMTEAKTMAAKAADEVLKNVKHRAMMEQIKVHANFAVKELKESKKEIEKGKEADKARKEEEGRLNQAAKKEKKRLRKLEKEAQAEKTKKEAEEAQRREDEARQEQRKQEEEAKLQEQAANLAKQQQMQQAQMQQAQARKADAEERLEQCAVCKQTLGKDKYTAKMWRSKEDKKCKDCTKAEEDAAEAARLREEAERKKDEEAKAERRRKNKEESEKAMEAARLAKEEQEKQREEEVKQLLDKQRREAEEKKAEADRKKAEETREKEAKAAEKREREAAAKEKKKMEKKEADDLAAAEKEAAQKKAAKEADPMRTAAAVAAAAEAEELEQSRQTKERSKQRLLEILQEVKLEVYAKVFADKGITTVKAFSVMTEAEFEQLGVKKFHQKKLLDVQRSIKALRLDEERQRFCAEDSMPDQLKGIVEDYGAAASQHVRPTMEDEHVALRFSQMMSFFAVYDGHGGRQVAAFLKDNLHLYLRNLVPSTVKRDGTSAGTVAAMETALKEAIQLADTDVAEKVEGSMGCGATVGVVVIRSGKGHRMVHVANCGDVRAVLCRGSQAMRLSVDHKADADAERIRIEAAGGHVIGKRVQGVLAVARAVGDHALKKFVISEPYISSTMLEERDTHLILACDGLWDVMSDQDACDMIRDMPEDTPCLTIAKQLIVKATALRSTDNISVIVLRLPKDPKPQ